MMGLFTGFSVISGIEILYWLWFKIIFHQKDHEVAPEDEKAVESLSKEVQSMKSELKAFESVKSELEEIKMRLKGHSDDPKAGLYFDAIFNDVEAQRDINANTK